MKNTLSLCVICKNEEENIRNLLDSVKGDLFDEIVIVDTGSTDKTVEIIKEYTDKVFHFPWVNDFSAARNESFSHATSDYIMWLDSDDIIKEIDYKKLLQLKQKLNESPIWLIKYEYAHDEFGKSICSFYRERIIQRSLNLKWQEPIHEYLPLDASFKKTDIEVHHNKSHPTSDRNIPMLEDIVSKNPDVARNVFYLGKEYFDNGQVDKGIENLKRFVEMPGAWDENRYNAFLRISSYHKSAKEYNLAIDYCWKAIKINELKAEAYCAMGEIAMEAQSWQHAIHWFTVSSNMIRPEDALDIIEPKYHTWLPNLQLCLCYNNIGKVYEAAVANERALEYRPADARMLNNRRIFKENLGDKYPGSKEDTSVLDTIDTIAEEEKKEFKGKIGFFTSQNREDGSNRIRIMHIYNELKNRNCNVEFFDPAKEDTYDVVITKSFSKEHIDYFKSLQEKGIKVILDYNEDVTFDFNVRHMLNTVNSVVVCSEELAKVVKEYNSEVTVIEDAYEYDSPETKVSGLDKLQVYWFGYGGSSWMAEKMREMIEDDLDMKLITIHEHPDADIPYTVDTVYGHLEQADIIIVPANFRRQPCKSNNRLTQAMAMNKPVVCDPMPSYRSIVDNYKNAITTVNGTDTEWRYALKELKNDPELRKTLSINGYETATNYSIGKMTDKWVNTLISIDIKSNLSSTKIERESIDVVIPTKNNIDILDGCLQSFKNSKLNETVYIIDNGEGVQDLVEKYNIPYEVRDI